MIYLASPYSDPDPQVKQCRYEKVCVAAARLMAEGQMVFSPIAMCHGIAIHGNLPGTFAYWHVYNRHMIDLSTILAVLMLPGWENSIGVQEEIRIARELNKSIVYMEAELAD